MLMSELETALMEEDELASITVTTVPGAIVLESVKLSFAPEDTVAAPVREIDVADGLESNNPKLLPELMVRFAAVIVPLPIFRVDPVASEILSELMELLLTLMSKVLFAETETEESVRTFPSLPKPKLPLEVKLVAITTLPVWSRLPAIFPVRVPPLMVVVWELFCMEIVPVTDPELRVKDDPAARPKLINPLIVPLFVRLRARLVSLEIPPVMVPLLVMVPENPLSSIAVLVDAAALMVPALVRVNDDAAPESTTLMA